MEESPVLTLVRVTSVCRFKDLGDSRRLPTRSLTAPLLTYSTCGFAKEMGEAGRDHLMALLYSKCSKKRWSTTFWGGTTRCFRGRCVVRNFRRPANMPPTSFSTAVFCAGQPTEWGKGPARTKLPVSTRSRAILANVALRRLGKCEKKNRKQQNYGQLRGIVDRL